MRDTEILLRPTLALLLTVLGSSVACKSDNAASEPETKREAKPEVESSSKSERESPTSASDKLTAEDPQRADKLADLDALCKALDHDYVDGTLSDYYRDVEPRTEWGKAQREAGNQSIQPGRLLEKAVAELAPTAAEPVEHCRKLLDYLDDVE
ncbi:MAG TPA: hypothetical protein VM869_00600 [Enhygromyxa sp.]|nr:hypothetical protein [Enhygromyxa sp.]